MPGSEFLDLSSCRGGKAFYKLYSSIWNLASATEEGKAKHHDTQRKEILLLAGRR